jgi:hypothetical protein
MSEARDNGTIHRADPQYRRRMQMWLVVCSIAGAILLACLVWWLSQLTQVMSQGDVDAYQRWLQRLMAGICLLLAAAAAGFAFWLQRLARATKAERRWPPASMPTSADMRIRYLTSADALVTQLQAGAWGLFALAFALAAWATWLLWPR